MNLRYLGLGLLAAALIVGGIWTSSAIRHHQVDQRVGQADQHHENATKAAGQGAVYDQQAEARKSILAMDDTAVQHEHAQVLQLRAELAKLRTPAPVSSTPPDAPPVDLAPVVAKQDQLISALTSENAALRTANADLQSQTDTLIHARNAWKQSAGESAAEALQLRAALKASQGLVKAQRWEGRIEGLAIGLGGGFAIGRFTK